MAGVGQRFVALECQELLLQRGAQRGGQHAVGRQRVAGLGQTLGQGGDATGADLGQRQVEQVVGAGRAGVQPAIDAIQPGGDQAGGGQVGVGAGVRQPPFETSRQCAQQGAAVVGTMGHEGWGPAGS